MVGIGNSTVLSFYRRVPSTFGSLALLWRDTPEGPRVQRLLLPREGMPADSGSLGSGHWPLNTIPGSCPPMAALAEQIGRFLAGEEVTFPLEMLALEACSAFQQRVLRVEHSIPRGCVSSYGRIAAHLGLPGAARAVGAALASNPFPILIPCHRVVRADGTLGGYRGGVAMKRALLEMEGVAVSAEGKVLNFREGLADLRLDRFHVTGIPSINDEGKEPCLKRSRFHLNWSRRSTSATTP